MFQAEGKLKNPFRRVVIILSAPRSGSSFLYSLLSKHPQVISFAGEESPLLKATLLKTGRARDLIAPHYDDSKLTLKESDYEYFFVLARRMVGSYSESFDVGHLDHYRTRFAWQWGHLVKPLSNQEIKNSDLISWLGLLGGKAQDALGLYEGHESDHSKYLLSDSDFIEDTPYTWAREFRAVDDSEISRSTLLLKTSTHSYRIKNLLEIFAGSDISFIYLKRHPYATVNGLIDGWNYPGFHSYNIRKHYAKRGPRGDGLWKFDLYPEWERDLSLPIEEIALKQCLLNHQAILNSQKQLALNFYELSYEELCNSESLGSLFESLTQFLGLSRWRPDSIQTKKRVMSTSHEGPLRWQKRKSYFESLFAKYPQFDELVAKLVKR